MIDSKVRFLLFTLQNSVWWWILVFHGLKNKTEFNRFYKFYILTTLQRVILRINVKGPDIFLWLKIFILNTKAIN